LQFSVLTDPVIPVVKLDGTSAELGIRDVFFQAHEVQDIRGNSPLERYALLRLLIAFAMDMLALENARQRRALLRAGCFDMSVFDAYIKDCEKDGPRFDLFDEHHPFLQSVYDVVLDAKAEKPVASLFQALPTGNNHIFFDHRMEDEHEVTIAQAFRGLCSVYLFCTAGAQGYPSSVNNTPPMYVVAVGTNLFETIVMNMLSQRECGNIPYGLGDVPWRHADAVIPKMEYPSVSMLGGLTWMPRRITLVQQEGGMVKRVYLQQGKNFKGNDLWKDLHVPYRKKKDGAFASVKPETGRAFWRDIGTMVYDPNAQQTMQPLALKAIENVLDLDEQTVVVRAVGMVTNQASIVQWQEDELRIPAVLLNNEESAITFREDIACIEIAQNQIGRAIQTRLKTELADETKMVFLRCMQSIAFTECLDQIIAMEEADELDDAIERHRQWLDNTIVREMLKAISRVIESSCNDLKAMVLHEEIRKEACLGYKKLARGGRK